MLQFITPQCPLELFKMNVRWFHLYDECRGYSGMKLGRAARGGTHDHPQMLAHVLMHEKSGGKSASVVGELTVTALARGSRPITLGAFV